MQQTRTCQARPMMVLEQFFDQLVVKLSVCMPTMQIPPLCCRDQVLVLSRLLTELTPSHAPLQLLNHRPQHRAALRLLPGLLLGGTQVDGPYLDGC